MGKRKNAEKKLDKYFKKIRKIERRLKASQHNLSLDEETSDHISSNSDEDHLPQNENCSSGETLTHSGPSGTATKVAAQVTIGEPEDNEITNLLPESSETINISSEILMALDPLPEQPKFGPKICDEVARIMNNILKNGLKKESKTSLMTEVIPENCPMLIAPKINLEVATAVGDNIRNRDKNIEYEQNQLGVGLSVLSRVLSSLIVNENMDRINMIAFLSNAIRILADLHAVQTKARKNLTLPALDKQFLNLVKDVERDEYLFGKNLNEKINAIKNSQRSGNSIKKSTPNPKQGNYSGPSRYKQNGTRAVMRNGSKRYPVVKNYQQKFQRKPNPEVTLHSSQMKPRVPGPK